MKKIAIGFALFALGFFVFSLPIKAEETFDAGLVLTDVDLLQYQTMSAVEIQEFLNKHEGSLKSYRDVDVDGVLKSAAEVIADAAVRHQVNPQYILVLLQKEQGLVTDPAPKPTQLAWATGYAVCDNCDVNDPALQQYRGFAKQVDRAAWRTRYFYEHPSEFHYLSGNSYSINGQDVFIQNDATAALYNYTPHIHGNQVFWRLFHNWFGTVHPDGTLLQGFGQPGVWLIKDGQRHAFVSKVALTSRYNINNVVQVAPSFLDQYPIGAAVTFTDFALVSTPAGKTYLLVHEEKRLIASDAVFRTLGFSPDEVETAANDDQLAFFRDGDPIDANTLQPFGALLQDPQTHGVYYVMDGIKQPLIASELIKLNFPDLRVRKASQDELDHYTKGAPVTLKDGLLVKSKKDPRVYVIANGKKLPIHSEYTFNSLGYKWTNIHTVSDALLAIHPLGDELKAEQISDTEINNSTDFKGQD